MEIEYNCKYVACTSKSTLSIKKLVSDLRKCYTPSSRFHKSLPSNKPYDHILLADHYKIGHFIFISQSETGCYLRIFNYLNKGPTYTFTIRKYTTIAQIGNICETYSKDPLVLVDKELKLDFVNKHRCVDDVERVLTFLKEDGIYYFRHYRVCRDDEKIRLVEIGPRIEMELYKIEDGIMEGEILYNKNVFKSKEEIEENRKRIKEREDLKLERRLEQERNVERKKMSTIKQESESIESSE